MSKKLEKSNSSHSSKLVKLEPEELKEPPITTTRLTRNNSKTSQVSDLPVTLPAATRPKRNSSKN